jgi:hypothetical protein
MTLTRFIRNIIKILEEEKFSLTEQELFIKKNKLYTTLKNFDKNVTIDAFSEKMIANSFCPNTLQPSFPCKGCEKKCKVCWSDFLEKKLKPFQHLTIHSVLHKNPEVENNIKIVKSKDYINWLYEYINKNKYLDSEKILYDENEKNAEYGKLLFLFLLYINDLIDETDLENLADYNEYESEKYNLKIKDKYYELCVVIGQGSIMFINELPHKPNDFLDLSIKMDSE